VKANSMSSFVGLDDDDETERRSNEADDLETVDQCPGATKFKQLMQRAFESYDGYSGSETRIPIVQQAQVWVNQAEGLEKRLKVIKESIQILLPQR